MRKRWVERQAGERTAYRVKVGPRSVWPWYMTTLAVEVQRAADARALMRAARRAPGQQQSLAGTWTAPRPPWQALETPDSAANAALRPD